MTKEQFVNEINNLRKRNKDKWYEWYGLVDEKQIWLKGFNTWIQVIRTPDFSDGSVIDQSVKNFKLYLEKVITWQPNMTESVKQQQSLF